MNSNRTLKSSSTLNSISKYVIQPCTELANPGPGMTLSKEQLHALQRKGLVRVLAEQVSTPVISEQNTPEVTEFPQEEPLNKSVQVNWPVALTKKMIDIVVPKKADQKNSEKKLKEEQFWKEVAIELNSTMTGTQCKNKYYNLDRERKRKKRASWGDGVVLHEECLQYLDNALHSGEGETFSLEMPKEEVSNLSILYTLSSPSLESSDTVIPGAEDMTSVNDMLILDKKRVRETNESCTHQDGDKSILQKEWLTYLSQSNKMRWQELKYQEDRMAILRANFKLKKEKLAMLQTKIKDKKTQQEEKRIRQKKKDELIQKLMQMENKKNMAIRNLIKAYSNLSNLAPK